MKVASLCLALVLLTGCGLIPKKVELFQSTVKEMPQVTTKNIEFQKETADLASKKARETLVAAVSELASTNVIKPAADTVILTDSLSGSLGKPSALWTGSAEALVSKLDREDAKYDNRLEHFRNNNDELAGKKIEGTGIIQLPYFLYLGVLFVIVILAYLGVKILAIVAQGTPYGSAVSVGTKIIQGGSKAVTSLVSKGFSEIIEGGELFKKWIDTELEDEETRDKVKELFQSAHKESQSRDVQDIVKNITK